MGIPKFFRYISERYPLTSQLIQENKIPEFDNLYLDFNGIIHNCSHPNDDDAHFRMSEEQIFTAIFAYVDMLFGKIKPKKLFFMAVDGVAPRAKMNQQRSRRFRTAKEAREVREKAERAGEELPKEKAFDSNCITPGTPFMARLSDQLRYFVNKKITEDSDWRGVEVVLSGHEVPGEGEHKIMEYIRLSRAQPGYDPNVRHCMYGLDADLIMLSLLSHDPHFCLLREEVKFGPASKKRNTNLESLNFYLLHISLMREYLDLEFNEIAPVLPFDYSLERIIDDFILLAAFVGNDFLPNLPDLHIHENGLERLFEVYKKVLPSLDGYINEGGRIEMRRLQVVLDEMRIWEREVFEREYADASWFKGKQSHHGHGNGKQQMEAARKRNKLVLTPAQRTIFDRVRRFVLDARATPPSKRQTRLEMPNDFPARDRAFIATLAEELHLPVSLDEMDASGEKNVVVWRLPGASMSQDVPVSDPESPSNGANVIEEKPSGGLDDETFGGASANGNGNGSGNGNEDEWEDVDSADEDEESRAAVDRVLKKYLKAEVIDPEDDEGGFDAREEKRVREKMDEWKREYYKSKLEISYDNPEQMGALVHRYVEGLQWVMYYYYSGVTSWGWFYDYHYAPRISDLQGVANMTFDFELGTPFRPYEQLMGVLPAASRELIPQAFQDLMTDPNSPILDFYPMDFEQDLNGKKAEWEAIVKIPFIDEKRLLSAMASREHRLTNEERARNGFGTSTSFKYDPDTTHTYPSSLPHFFPPIYRCTCIMSNFDLPTLDGLHLVPGLCDGVFLGVDALAGFPSLKTLPHVAMLGFHGVNVHGSESRNKSMVVHIQNPHEGRKTEDVAREMIGKRTFVGWPFLQEGMVVAVSDSLFKYEMWRVVPGAPEKVVSTPHAPQALSHWKGKAERIESFYSKKCGAITGDVDVLVHVRPLKGMKRLESGAFVKDYEGPEKEMEQAAQMVISEVACEDPRFMEKEAPSLAEEFPEDSNIFFLGEHAYGTAARVSKTEENSLSIVLAFIPSAKDESERFLEVVHNRVSHEYFLAHKAASMLGISGRALSRITSSFMVLDPGAGGVKTNIGLSLKFEAKALKVINWSRKEGRQWEFSDRAVDLLRDYKAKFPEVFRCLDQNGDAMTRVEDIWPDKSQARLKELKAWLKEKGVRDFEPVSLFSDQLDKATVGQLEELANEVAKTAQSTAFKKAIVKGIPRHAVLKPQHAVYRLQNQRFVLGDRVTMVQDSGSVPIAVKGVVIGLNSKSMDVLWDVAFMAGTTLGDRCSPYRGSTVEFASCLNLTQPQFIASTSPGSKPPPKPTQAFNPRAGPYPAVRPAQGQQAVAGFRPASELNGLVQIMTNPHRGGGRGGGGSGPRLNGHGPVHAPPNVQHVPVPAAGATQVQTQAQPAPNERGRGRGGFPPRGGPPHQHPNSHPHAHTPNRGGFVPRGGHGPPRGGRGGPRGGFRGRGGVVQTQAS